MTHIASIIQAKFDQMIAKVGKNTPGGKRLLAAKERYDKKRGVKIPSRKQK